MSRKVAKTINSTIFYIVMILVTLIMIFPFLWALSGSFKTTSQMYNGNVLDLIPHPFIMDNYNRVLTLLPFLRFIINTVFLAMVIPILSLFFAALAAYSFAKLRFKGRDVLFLLFLGTMMIPGTVTLIPNYIMISKLHWTNNYLALIIPAIFTDANVFNIFFLKQYFYSIPNDLENAAIIDGCSRLRLFFNIIIPNSKPAFATLAILSFSANWNAFLWPLIVMNDYKMMPIQVGLSYLQGMTDHCGEILAGATLAILPIVIIFLVFQKYIMNSTVTSGFGGM